MHSDLINKLISKLQEKGVLFSKGLTEEEIQKIKEIFGIVFPPDLMLFLKTKLPISEGFAQWRYAINGEKGRKDMNVLLRAPLEGILFDVQYNEFWMKEWGRCPKRISERKEIAKEKYKDFPQLIPIYSHRYLVGEPEESMNPVLSVYQTDIIYYGANLFDYFANEFSYDLEKEMDFGEEIKPIKTWSEIVEGNYGSG